MSQSDYGTINASVKTGTGLASDLNSSRDANHSQHKGAARPSYVTAGMLWIKEVSANLWEINLYDGTADITLMTIDPGNDTILALPIASGGTGSTTAAGARTALGLGVLATATIAAIANGGTGASDAATARTNLGLAALAELAVATIATGGTGATNAAAARVNLGLLSAAEKNTGIVVDTVPLLQDNSGTPGFAALDGSLLVNLPVKATRRKYIAVTTGGTPALYRATKVTDVYTLADFIGTGYDSTKVMAVVIKTRLTVSLLLDGEFYANYPDGTEHRVDGLKTESGAGSIEKHGIFEIPINESQLSLTIRRAGGLVNESTIIGVIQDD